MADANASIPSEEVVEPDQNTVVADQPTVEEDEFSNPFEESDESEVTEDDTEESESEETDSEVPKQTDEEVETEDAQPPEMSEEERKEHNAKMAQQRIAEKEEREKTSTEQAAKDEQYLQGLRDKAAATAREADSDTAKKLEALETRELVREVESNREALTRDNERAVKDIGVFNPESPDYVEGAYERALSRFGENYVQTDPESQTILGAYHPRTGQRVSLYNYLKEESEPYLAGKKAGSLEGQANAARVNAAVETPSAAAPKKAKTDPIADIWDSDD